MYMPSLLTVVLMYVRQLIFQISMAMVHLFCKIGKADIFSHFKHRIFWIFKIPKMSILSAAAEKSINMFIRLSNKLKSN